MNAGAETAWGVWRERDTEGSEEWILRGHDEGVDDETMRLMRTKGLGWVGGGGQVAKAQLKRS